MRPVMLALVVALALPPLAAANEAPVAQAEVQAEARLREPVLFTSTSHDADGTIVATTWEDSDGRTRAGASVVIAFQYPGVHTVTLRVTDDAGATSALEIAIMVHAPLMHGRAYALRAGDATFADTGDVVTQYQTDHADAVGAWNQGALRVAGLDATLRTLDERAVARTDVGYVYIPLPIGYVLITGIEAESIVGCEYPTIRNAKFTQVRLNDSPLVPPGDVAPNTRVPLPGGALLELNVQEAPSLDRLSSIAVRFTSTEGVVHEIAHTEAGVSHCPWT